MEEVKLIPDRPVFDRRDYFIKLSNPPRNMKGASISVDHVETLGHDTLVSLVTIVYVNEFGHRFPDGVIVVVLKIIKGEMKIFRCIDSYPEA